MGFVKGSCNAERRPRCVATIPHVKKLLTEARAHGVLVLHSVPCGSASGDLIVADLAPLPGEGIIPPNGPNKFLPFDVLCSHSDIGFDLEKLLEDHGIKTVITVGTQVQTAVLHTAAEAAAMIRSPVGTRDICRSPETKRNPPLMITFIT